MVELDSTQLEALSYYMLNQVKNNQCDTKDNKQLTGIILKMISENKVDPNEIGHKLKADLGLL